jgi:ribonucleoside-diphosphate reductase alpha chain
LSIGQNCSSGIEPIFSLQYERNIRTGKGDETKKEVVYDYAWLNYLDYLKREGKTFTGVPEYFKTTFDIDVYRAMDIQIMFQRYIDNSISKTLNLPVGTSYKEYNDLFHYAYSNKLKGFTTFNPDGSMKGVLEVSGSKKEEDRETPKRPKELPCDIHEVRYNKEDYILLVGKYNNLPYEIFVTKNVNKEFDFKKNKTGKIIKKGKGKYSLVIENGSDKTYIEDIISSFDSVYGTLGRFISMGLRHRVPLQFLVEQLNKDKNFAGFERTVSRVLKKYIGEGEIVKTSYSCPDCGNNKLEYREGCLTCPECGWSKCS